jgi:hypothetical protein
MFIVSLGRLLVVQPAYSKDATRALIHGFVVALWQWRGDGQIVPFIADPF